MYISLTFIHGPVSRQLCSGCRSVLTGISLQPKMPFFVRHEM